MISSSGRAQFKLSYEISPIFLVNGIMGNLPGAAAPIISFTDSANYDLGLLSSSNDVSLDDFFAYYRPLPGAELQANEYGMYPFGNQTIAANAVIVQPLHVSLLMVCPTRDPGSYTNKLQTFTALKSTLDQHINSGGLFNVATPSYIYTNCLLMGLKCVDAGGTDQVQFEWQWDFFQPLVTLAAARAAQNTQMAKITSQTQVTGDPPTSSTASNAVGNPGSNVSSAVVPAGNTTQGGAVPGPQPVAAAGTTGGPQLVAPGTFG